LHFWSSKIDGRHRFCPRDGIEAEERVLRADERVASKRWKEHIHVPYTNITQGLVQRTTPTLTLQETDLREHLYGVDSAHLRLTNEAFAYHAPKTCA